jgi:hypothetical protein
MKNNKENYMQIPSEYVLQIEKTFRRVKPANIKASGACLVWSFATLAVLTSKNIRAVLQAGTCMWPRIRPEQDDGICDTHFGYQWSPATKESLIAVANGKMPEIHIWVAIPKTQTIIDFSTREFPNQCKELIGQDWPGDRPPKYLWCTVDELPERVLYKPNMDAIQYASLAMEKFLNEDMIKGE